MKKFYWAVLAMIFSVIFTPFLSKAELNMEEIHAYMREESWNIIDFPPKNLDPKRYLLPFYVVPKSYGGETLFDVPVFVDTSFYDPHLCVEVPEYLRGVSWVDPRMNCENPAGWWRMFSGRSILDGCSGRSCYGVSAACPSSITVLDGEHVSASLLIDGIGRRTCYDTGGEISLAEAVEVDGWTVPVMSVDVLVDLSKGLPRWDSGQANAVLTLDVGQLLALIQALAKMPG
ncbi:MAG: hypothetical protein WC243_00830 [Patescibacteria group bacterium]